MMPQAVVLQSGLGVRAPAGAWAPGMEGGLAEEEEWGSRPAPGSDLWLWAEAWGRLLVLSVPPWSS